MAGSEQIVPTHATVSMVHSFGVDPHVTKTAGNGYIIVPGRHDILDICTKLSMGLQYFFCKIR